MAKSLKKTEQTLDSVIQHIVQPSAALVATAGMVGDPSSALHHHNQQQQQHFSPEDYSPSESSGSRMLGVEMDQLQAEHHPHRHAHAHAHHHHQTHASHTGAGTASSAVVDDGVRFESGLGRQGMQWNAWSGGHEESTDGPRLHSLPSNTLNP